MHLTIFSFDKIPKFAESVSFTFELKNARKNELSLSSKTELVLIFSEENTTISKNLCHQLRKKGVFLPIVVVGQKISSSQGKIFLNQGADDYLGGEWETAELEARLKALLRRPKIFITSPLKIKNLSINFFKRQVKVNKKELFLTPREFDILEYLSKNQQRLVSRDELSLELWDSDFNNFSLTVNSHLYNLRNKLKKSGSLIKIATVSGGGYFLK